VAGRLPMESFVFQVDSHPMSCTRAQGAPKYEESWGGCPGGCEGCEKRMHMGVTRGHHCHVEGVRFVCLVQLDALVGGSWAGSWQSGDGFKYDAVLHIKEADRPGGPVRAEITWTLRTLPRTASPCECLHHTRSHVVGCNGLWLGHGPDFTAESLDGACASVA
jgi:hypothetical protein